MAKNILPLIVRIVLAVLSNSLAGFSKFGVSLLQDKATAKFLSIVAAVCNREKYDGPALDSFALIDMARQYPDTLVYKNGYIRTKAQQIALDEAAKEAKESNADKRRRLDAYATGGGIAV